MADLSREELLEQINKTLIYAIAHIDGQYGDGNVGKALKEEMRQTHIQIHKLIQRKVGRKWIPNCNEKLNEAMTPKGMTIEEIIEFVLKELDFEVED